MDGTPLAAFFDQIQRKRADWERVFAVQQRHMDEFGLGKVLDLRTFSLACALLAKRGSKQRAPEEVYGSTKVEGEDVATAMRMARHAKGVYEANLDQDVLNVAWSLIVDDDHEEIVIAVRGTDTLSDVLTDVTLAPHKLDRHHAHLGVLEAARNLVSEARSPLKEKVSQHPQYQIWLTGHSLGGGCAALATYLLQKDYQDAKCIAFGPAACMSGNLVEETKPFIASYIHASDCVPRLSWHSAARLTEDLASIDWHKEAQEILEDSYYPSFMEEAIREHLDEKTMQLKRDFEATLKERQSHKQPVALFPPGRTLHICREGIIERSKEYWHRIDLSPTLLEDHFMDNYIQALSKYD